MDVFVSVGTGLSATQEAFVSALEARLRSEGLNPCTVGRNYFSVETPLKTVGTLMDRCSGTVIVALDRYYFPQGVERPGSDREQKLGEVSFPTSWNQIEAAMAYRSEHPLLVIVDEKLRTEGLLESGNDWFVQKVDPVPSSLNTPTFNGVFVDWRSRVQARASVPVKSAGEKVTNSPADMTIGNILSNLKPGELWKVVAGVGAIVAGAFLAGTQAERALSHDGSVSHATMSSAPRPTSSSTNHS